MPARIICILLGIKKKGQDTIPVQLTTDGEPNYTFNREDEGKIWKDVSEPNLLIGFQVAIVFMLFVRITGTCVIYGLINSLSTPYPTLKTYKAELAGDKHVTQYEFVGRCRYP